MTRNRIFTDGLLSYIKRPSRSGGPGGADRPDSADSPGGAGHALRPLGSLCALWAGDTLWAGGPSGPVRPGDPLGTGGPHGAGHGGIGRRGRRSRRPGRRRGRRTGRLWAAAAAGEGGVHAAAAAPLPIGRIVLFHNALLCRFSACAVAVPRSILCSGARGVSYGKIGGFTSGGFFGIIKILLENPPVIACGDASPL